MVDCVRASITDELVESKGDFTCKDDYLPTGNLVGYKNFDLPSPAVTCDLGCLYRAIPSSFTLTLISDSDEFKSWQSELFTTEDAPIESESLAGVSPADHNKIGLCSPEGSFLTNPPAGFYLPRIEYNQSLWTGESFNTGWCGRTIQFYFNLYKKYCCIVDDRGNVTDYYFDYYYSVFQLIDGVLDRHCGCGEIDFCDEDWSVTSQYQSQFSCYLNVRPE